MGGIHFSTRDCMSKCKVVLGAQWGDEGKGMHTHVQTYIHTNLYRYTCMRAFLYAHESVDMLCECLQASLWMCLRCRATSCVAVPEGTMLGTLSRLETSHTTSTCCPGLVRLNKDLISYFPICFTSCTAASSTPMLSASLVSLM